MFVVGGKGVVMTVWEGDGYWAWARAERNFMMWVCVFCACDISGFVDMFEGIMGGWERGLHVFTTLPGSELGLEGVQECVLCPSLLDGG